MTLAPLKIHSYAPEGRRRIYPTARRVAVAHSAHGDGVENANSELSGCSDDKNYSGETSKMHKDAQRMVAGR